MGSVARYRILIAIAAAVPLMLSGAACSSGNPASPVAVPSSAGSGGGVPLTPAPAPQTLYEAGSTLLQQAMGHWAAGYHDQYPNVVVKPGGGGSTKGISEASAGTIKTWSNPAISQLNPHVSLPSTPVVPLHRSDGSGDTFLFTSYLSTHDSNWNRNFGYGTKVAWPKVAGAKGETGNQGMVKGCHDTVGCVAYIGISFQNAANQAQLGEAALLNTANQPELPNKTSIDAAVAAFVSSTPPNETISMIDGPASTGYPIVNYEYAIVSTQQRSATAARDLKAFLHWIITTGNSLPYLGSSQFQPLPGPVVSLSDAQIAKIR